MTYPNRMPSVPSPDPEYVGLVLQYQDLTATVDRLTVATDQYQTELADLRLQLQQVGSVLRRLATAAPSTPQSAIPIPSTN